MLEQLQAGYVKAGDSDKIIAAGEKLLAIDPDDPEAALQNLKASEAKKDVEGVKKWSTLTSANARKLAADAQACGGRRPGELEERSGLCETGGYLFGICAFQCGVDPDDPKVVIELSPDTGQRNPKGEYFAEDRTASVYCVPAVRSQR